MSKIDYTLLELAKFHELSLDNLEEFLTPEGVEMHNEITLILYALVKKDKENVQN